MQDHENADPTAPKRVPWNKGKLIGAKPPLRPKHVWSTRPEAVNHGIAAASTNRRLFQRYPPSTDIGMLIPGEAAHHNEMIAPTVTE